MPRTLKDATRAVRHLLNPSWRPSEYARDEPRDGIAEAVSVFEQPWWLDAVAPAGWDVAIVHKKDRLLARWPYAVTHRAGLTLVQPPPLSPHLGPWLRITSNKRAKRLSATKQLIGDLAEALPDADVTRFVLHPSHTYGLPLIWSGFELSVRYTYVVRGLDDLDGVWSRMDGRVRTDVRRADHVEVAPDGELAEFIGLHRKTFERQGVAYPFSEAFMRRLDGALAQRDLRTILIARDAEGRPNAGAYILWDGARAYYLMGGIDHDLEVGGAQSKVLWEAMQLASARGCEAFDFEGSMIASIERYFRSFGGEPVPLLEATRLSLRARALLDGREALRALRARWGGDHDA